MSQSILIVLLVYFKFSVRSLTWLAGFNPNSYNPKVIWGRMQVTRGWSWQGLEPWIQQTKSCKRSLPENPGSRIIKLQMDIIPHRWGIVDVGWYSRWQL